MGRKWPSYACFGGGCRVTVLDLSRSPRIERGVRVFEWWFACSCRLRTEGVRAFLKFCERFETMAVD